MDPLTTTHMLLMTHAGGCAIEIRHGTPPSLPVALVCLRIMLKTDANMLCTWSQSGLHLLPALLGAGADKPVLELLRSVLELHRNHARDAGDTITMAFEAGSYTQARPRTVAAGLVPVTRRQVVQGLRCRLSAHGCKSPMYQPRRPAR